MIDLKTCKLEQLTAPTNDFGKKTILRMMFNYSWETDEAWEAFITYGLEDASSFENIEIEPYLEPDNFKETCRCFIACRNEDR